MGQLQWEQLAIVVVALMGMVSTIYATRQKAEIDSDAVVTAARAQIDASYKGVIDALSEEIKRLNDKLASEAAAKEEEIEGLHAQLIAQKDEFRRCREQCQAEIDHLTTRLTQAGQLPPIQRPGP